MHADNPEILLSRFQRFEQSSRQTALLSLYAGRRDRIQCPSEAAPFTSGNKSVLITLEGNGIKAVRDSCFGRQKTQPFRYFLSLSAPQQCDTCLSVSSKFNRVFIVCYHLRKQYETTVLILRTLTRFRACHFQSGGNISCNIVDINAGYQYKIGFDFCSHMIGFTFTHHTRTLKQLRNITPTLMGHDES